MREKITKLITEFGVVAVVLWYGVFALTWIGFAVAIQAGFTPASSAGELGVWAAAYLATQLTKPIRLVVVVALTPPIGHLLSRKNRLQVPPDQCEQPPTKPET